MASKFYQGNNKNRHLVLTKQTYMYITTLNKIHNGASVNITAMTKIKCIDCMNSRKLWKCGNGSTGHVT